MKTIWVDADACSRESRRITLRLAKYYRFDTYLVANHALAIRESDTVKVIVCSKEKNAADDYISVHIDADDIAICRDIELIQLLLKKGAFVLNDRGKIYTREDIEYDVLRRNRAHMVHTQLGMVSKGKNKKKQSYSKEFSHSLQLLLKN